ncbi:SdiA-regulated domain-containing protein [Mesonia sp. HuA40]|uniref:SdiA-regulated domain-containing protein n=1 Tax=Mesonia sp. HuA40 TaxID=2602761 RepID=UPI0011CC80F3|nr:SdiA-regulated domain-containing protein [Mesonia sp. HuA40]TXK70964.1 hypothetical protein FT993_10290 [Mesonia sp. HuA40]
MGSYFKSPPFFITIGILAFVGIIYFNFKDHYKIDYDNPSEVIIKNTWKLPRELEEVSGIVYLNDKQLACVQDEMGLIYLYNIVIGKVEQTIEFGPQDDYEGIAFNGNDLYTVTSAGKIFEIKSYLSDSININTYQTKLSPKHDIEGFTYNPAKNQLWLAAKQNGHKDEKYKGVYAFDLTSKRFIEEPIFKLKFDNPIFKELKDVGSKKIFRTSEIAIHPQTKDIYMLDAKIPKLLILNRNWEAEKLIVLDPDQHPQPEGITFSPDGKIFLSNEGEWKPATIHRVEIKNKKATKKK